MGENNKYFYNMLRYSGGAIVLKAFKPKMCGSFIYTFMILNWSFIKNHTQYQLPENAFETLS